MAIKILPERSAAYADTNERFLIDLLRDESGSLGLDEAFLFYNFPLFREEDELLVAELVLASPNHGVILISTSNELPGESVGAQLISERLEGAFNQVFSKFVKYPRLRIGRGSLAFSLDAFLWVPEGAGAAPADCIKGRSDFLSRINSHRRPNPLDVEIFSEILSVLDGSKALIRAKDRPTQGRPASAKVSIINSLEEEIRKFDRDQRVAYMTAVDGVQRIRGLAGSGKTVVLAMKAALTAIREPDAHIAVTFYTKSLYQHIKQLITRFYRLYDDKDPDWNRIQILHAWGGESIPGFYYLACKRAGVPALNFSQARQFSPSNPFTYVCARLLADANIPRMYDCVFVDEAQDFPPEFMRLALKTAEDENLVVAYDVFQSIFDVEIPEAATLFGKDSDAASVTFAEDVILRKCYRNPREILVCAHAIGFGVYGDKVVQMLESEEHWNDFGYEVESGNLIGGQEVVIDRPAESSPSSISSSQDINEILRVEVLKDFSEEVQYVVDAICYDISENGVPAEDVLVISADDRNGSAYFSAIRKGLESRGVSINNMQDDSYSIRDFQKEGRVTFATIYKAKGNEAYCVYIVGIDSLFNWPGPKNRNKVFTAMTRAKGWLSVTGIGHSAAKFRDEISAAKKNFPKLKFVYPSPETLVYMRRDLIGAGVDEVDARINSLADDMSPDELEAFLTRKLRELKKSKIVRKKMK